MTKNSSKKLQDCAIVGPPESTPERRELDGVVLVAVFRLGREGRILVRRRRLVGNGSDGGRHRSGPALLIREDPVVLLVASDLEVLVT